jgi:hypothetical protein
MDPRLTNQERDREREAAAALLDGLRDHPEWTDAERADVFDRLIAECSQPALLAAVQGRLGDLRGHDGEAVLRLLEAFAPPELLPTLAHALVGQQDLPAERAWEALGLLHDHGLLEAYPSLAERWDELNEAFDDDRSIDQLLEQLEGDLEGVWLALQGMAAVEPEVRAQIIQDLSKRPLEPGLLEFLRSLAFSHEPITRDSALEALAVQADDDPRLIAAWATIAADHHDPDVAARAIQWLGGEAEDALARWASPDRPAPRLTRCLVSAVDGQGQGYVVLEAEDQGCWTSATFGCDVLHGVRGVFGQMRDDPGASDGVFAEVTNRSDLDVVEGASELALGLLAGSLLLCGPQTTPALRFWLERTAGPAIRPVPFLERLDDRDPATLTREEMAERAQTVLTACPRWVDESDLTYELAEEIALREGADAVPDPQRDAGIYRYLYEHRLQGQVELYRRMLFWMAAFWDGAGECELGRSALAVGGQLSDLQHVVPANPFLSAFTSQSLTAAMANLRQGVDLRNPELRAKQKRGLWS